MNKRYMDFVPAKGKTVDPRPVKKVTKTVSKPVLPVKEPRNVVPAAVKEPVKKATSDDYRLGVVEDLRGGSVTPVRNENFNNKNELRELKAKKVGMKEEEKAVPAEKASGLKTKTEDTFKTPKTRFINQDKVVKRPLSKNVYRKEVKVSEEAKGPVTIIEKPDKSAKISLVVTIIITIILGAAAGTVAFLLLPK